MSEQELNNGTNYEAETGTQTETNTAMIVWLVVSIVSFVMSLFCFVTGLIGILVSIGLLMLPMAGFFGLGFTVVLFAAAVVFLLIAIGALIGVFYCKKNPKKGAE